MIPKDDLKIERIRGKGPGGQHRNKTSSCVRVTHIPSGTVVVIDGRKQHQNLAVAMREIEHRLARQKAVAKAAAKKCRRDKVIHDATTIRTYDYKSGVVRDHRSGKCASIKDVLGKGRIELLAPDGVE